MSQRLDMLNGGLIKKIIIFTLPIMLQSLLQTLYNSADLIIVGTFAGGASLSAVGATTAIYNVFLSLFIGMSAGVDVVCSHHFGRGDYKGVKSIIDTSVVTGPLMGIIVAVIGFFTIEPILVLMDTPEEAGVLSMAVLYLKVLMIGVPFSVFFNFCSAVLRTAGETQKPFIFLCTSGILNVVLNVVMVAGFRLDVLGVAIATVVSQVVSAIMILICLLRNKGLFTFSFRNVLFSWKKLWLITRVGLPAGIQSCAFNLSNSFLQAGVNSFGPDAIEGSTAVATVEGMMYVTLASFQNAITTFVSQNIGANNLDRARKSFRYSLYMTIVLGIVLGVGMFLLGDFVMAIFIKGNPIAMDYAYQRYMITYPVYFLAGIMAVMPGAIRGMGYSVAPSVIAIVGACGVRIAWIYTVFQANRTLTTLYLVHPVTWVITIVSYSITYIIVLKKTRKKLQIIES